MNSKKDDVLNLELNKVHLGDCIEIIKKLPENSIDAIVTDPPYELGFMGKGRDSTGIANSVELWSECLRVIKPGGHLLAFSGTRTYHRMACAIEDAGFEVRDMLEWIYASGFPKSHNIGKNIEKQKVGGIKNLKIIGSKKGIKAETGTQGFSYNKEYVAGKCMGGKQIQGEIPVYEINNEWKGFGTATKPAHEPIIMARKPLSEKTIVENVLKHGTGAIDIDGTRIPISSSVYTNQLDNTSYKIPLQTLSELRGNIYTQLSSFLADKNVQGIPSGDEYVQQWLKLKDCLDGYSTYRGLYDVLSLIFQEGDQVSFQQLHDVHSGISYLRKELDDINEMKDTDLISICDDLLKLVHSYEIILENKQGQYTTNNIKNQEKVGESLGRFPANIICTDDALNDNEITKSSGNRKGEISQTKWGFMEYKSNGVAHIDYNDSGSKSRYFDIDVRAEKHGLLQFPKASKRERNEGCDGLEEKGKVFNGQSANASKDVKDVEARFNTKPTANHHPTVKPVHLMSWLIRLISKPGDIVLEPFAGSGTTCVAAKMLGRNFIACEVTEEYIPICEARIESAEIIKESQKQQSLFDC